ncbi:uncharacterized protein CTHT_0025200 [Thermochaetoides thermophila DSM 1495]|uniref:LysM domain-containing protein n=1 Tax=Chaetomium thermophilum (strain DSM 1495 / CBS 144.50 / IMI 039719) TaxID=759272 RepID=G0S5W8_CHATD|nr:hypothetical protein CTHT_0025200 [Thermochaetoides thermophila DSM 1495]EGS20684.1 hypothetical protein CTHT_0025200 [Thermochaetoides thermophila DSM 1495]
MTSYNQYGQGEAASYYQSAQQAYNQQSQRKRSDSDGSDGPSGDRGILGGIAGGVAGAVGGNKLGGKAGHSKLGTVLGAVAGAVAGHKLQDEVSEKIDEKKKKKEEEEAKKKREEEEKRRREEEEKRRREEQLKQKQRRDSSPSPSRNRNYAGGFSGSARDIRLENSGGDWILRASCRCRDGSYRDSTISLNKLLENDNGSFRWSSGRSAGGGHCAPAPQTYTVQPGDTLRAIAARFPGCGTFEDIARVNNIPNPDLIYPGQVLQIPGGQAPQHHAGGNFGASARNVRLSDGGRRLEAELCRADGRYVSASVILDERIGNDNGTLVFV